METLGLSLGVGPSAYTARFVSTKNLFLQCRTKDWVRAKGRARAKAGIRVNASHKES